MAHRVADSESFCHKQNKQIVEKSVKNSSKIINKLNIGIGRTKMYVLYQNCRHDWPISICVISNILGLANTIIWLVIMLPQLLMNYRRKSCRGLSLEFAIANFTAAFINFFFAFRTQLPLYSRIMAVYMPLIEVILLLQFIWYHPKGHTWGIIHTISWIGGVCVWIAVFLLEILAEELTPLLMWMAVCLWCTNLLPQLRLNLMLQSTRGQASVTLFLAFFGKTNDFLVVYLLNMPNQIVVLAFFSTSMAHFNIIQMIWYSLQSHDKNNKEECPTEQLVEGEGMKDTEIDPLLINVVSDGLQSRVVDHHNTNTDISKISCKPHNTNTDSMYVFCLKLSASLRWVLIVLLFVILLILIGAILLVNLEFWWCPLSLYFVILCFWFERKIRIHFGIEFIVYS